MNETDGLEFPLNTSGAVAEDDDLEKEEKDAIAFSHKTIEVSDTGSKQQQYLQYQEVAGANIDEQPFAVNLLDCEDDGDATGGLHSASMPNLHAGRNSLEYVGIDQIGFFTQVMAYLQTRINESQKVGSMAV